MFDERTPLRERADQCGWFSVAMGGPVLCLDLHDRLGRGVCS